MNKQLLIVLMAVCLVSTHAFVKRDLPTSADLEAQVAAIKTNLDEIVNKLKNEANKNLDPDTIKANFNNFVDAAQNALNSLVPTTEATKPAA